MAEEKVGGGEYPTKRLLIFKIICYQDQSKKNNHVNGKQDRLKDYCKNWSLNQFFVFMVVKEGCYGTNRGGRV